MTRRIKRKKDFEVSLTLKNDDFIRPPRDAQRNWLLNEAPLISAKGTAPYIEYSSMG